jgi:hypothetical protein
MWLVLNLRLILFFSLLWRHILPLSKIWVTILKYLFVFTKIRCSYSYYNLYHIRYQ